MTDEHREGLADAAPPPGAAEAGGVQPPEDGAGADAAGGEGQGDAGSRDLGPLKDALEALIFVHRGILPPKTVREVLGEEFSAGEIEAGFAALRQEYEARGGALVLLEVAGGYQFCTRPDLAPWIQKLDFYEHHRHLSRPTLETLAIIAYKQPVTRAEIEAIRGVSVERIVRTLIERKLVRILGHKDVPGKPMVLGTSKEFLELFGLNSLADLPPLKDFIELPPGGGIEEEQPPEAAGGLADDAERAGGDELSAGGQDDEGSGEGRLGKSGSGVGAQEHGAESAPAEPDEEG